MNPLRKEQKESVIERVSFIKLELGDLKEKYSDLDWSSFSQDREKRRNVERIAENVANCLIDIAKVILAGEQVEMPPTHQEAVLKLGSVGVVDKELAEKLAKLARIRNILAYRYLDIEWEMINNFIQEAPLLLAQFIDSLDL